VKYLTQFIGLLTAFSISFAADSLYLDEMYSFTCKPGKRIEYMLMRNNYNGGPLFLTVTSGKIQSKISVYDHNFQLINEVVLRGTDFSRLRCFSLDGILYMFMNGLYVMNPRTCTLDTIRLDSNDYHSLRYCVMNDDTLIIASDPEKIHLYSFPGYRLYREIRRTGVRQLDIPQPVEDLIVYQKQSNELGIYSLSENRMLSSFFNDDKPAYFLVIKIGSFNDIVSWYRLIRGPDGLKLYYSTFSGSIFICDPLSPDTLIYKTRFRGDGNNAGLLTTFELNDMNRDGETDLIGTSVDHNIYCLSGKDLVPLWIYSTGGENQMPLSLCDINGDTIPEIFSVNDNMDLTVLNGLSGEAIFCDKLYLSGFQSSVGLTDLDSNGILEIVINLGPNEIRIYELNGACVRNKEIIWIPEL
jgi:hypothetical protein